MTKAVFLDRDGVLNRLVYNSATTEYESPHFLKDLEMLPNLREPLLALQKEGYPLFVVSNQPSYAKGKTSLENIKAIAEKVREHMVQQGVAITEYYYCYHHPDGIVAGFSGPCECRKPSPFFLRQAEKKYGLDLGQSWMVGDEDRDILCGQAAGVKTIVLNNANSAKKRGQAKPDFRAKDLADAVQRIMKESKKT